MGSHPTAEFERPLHFLKAEEGYSNNRSVMPSDVPGRTRATMITAVRIFIMRVTPWFFLGFGLIDSLVHLHPNRDDPTFRVTH